MSGRCAPDRSPLIAREVAVSPLTPSGLHPRECRDTGSPSAGGLGSSGRPPSRSLVRRLVLLVVERVDGRTDHRAAAIDRVETQPGMACIEHAGAGVLDDRHRHRCMHEIVGDQLQQIGVPGRDVGILPRCNPRRRCAGHSNFSLMRSPSWPISWCRTSEVASIACGMGAVEVRETLLRRGLMHEMAESAHAQRSRDRRVHAPCGASLGSGFSAVADGKAPRV